MSNDGDTTIIEYRKTVEARERKMADMAWPFRIAIGVIVVALVAVGAVIVERYLEKMPDAAKVTFGVITSFPGASHVIVRLGDEEVLRFIHEDGGDGRRCSCEVREGGL